MIVKPLQKKQSMNTLLLQLFSCIGIIPTTKFQMLVVNLITAIFVSLATAVISYRNYLSGMFFNIRTKNIYIYIRSKIVLQTIFLVKTIKIINRIYKRVCLN